MLTQDDLNEIKKIVDPLSRDISDVKKDLKDVKKRVRKIEKTTDVVIKVFDKEDVRLHKRITKLEEHLESTSKN